MTLCKKMVPPGEKVLHITFQDKANVRAQAIILFGNLSEFGDGPSKQPFLEQIHSNFVSLLLHLNDPDVEVKKVQASILLFLSAYIHYMMSYV